MLLMTIRRALGEFFGLRRNLVILLIAIFAIGAGEELWMRFIPKYLQALGATVFVIGTFDAIRTLLGAIYAYPGGLVVDHWGFRRAFIAFNVLSIVGYAIVLLVPHWGAVLCAMFLFLSWTCFSLPATFSLIAETLEANRHSMGIGMQSVIKRLPIMTAPFLDGVLIVGGPATGARKGIRGYCQDRALDVLAQPNEFQRAVAPIALERHPGPLLRTNSLRLGCHLRDG
jgi:MFS family permease